jgi:adenylyltransferase/sulfurtransferase
LIDYEAFCGIGAEPAYAGPEITVQELEREAAIGKPITVDVREPHEWEIVHLEGAG